jgi:serine/threonine protein kinase
MIIFNRYKILEQINHGSYGAIFKGMNIRTKEMVAIKIEKITTHSLLNNEARIYIYLRLCEGFPKVKWFGVEKQHNFLVMDLLGESLSMLKIRQVKLEDFFVIKIGIQMIQLLKSLHKSGLIHRDIKPDNFLFGLHQKSNVLHLIDLGFCKRYKLENNKHIEYNKISSIIGTNNYISLNVHNKIEPSRRDDMESIIYILLYLLDLITWNNKYDVNEIIEMKKEIINNIHLPEFAKSILIYVRNLQFDEEPNYDLLIQILNSSINKIETK